MKKLKSSELKSAILGIVLGDAYIDTTYNNCRLDIYVSAKNRDFAYMKYNILSQVGNLKVNMKEKYDKRILKNGNTREGIRIRTNTHPYITKIKKIPLFRKPEMLSPLGWAIWYMDDGSLCIKKNGNFSGCYLAMNRYPLEFVEHCQKVLKEKFNVNSMIQKHRQKTLQYLLRFNKNDCINFHRIISPYIVESMRYKLLEESRGSKKLQDIV